MTQAPAESPGLADRRVLVIEDDTTVSEVVRTYLRAAGYLVDSAEDAFSGLAAAAASAPDLIVLDRMLPGIDGAEVCRRIRAESAVPIIMLTALGSEDDRIDGLEAGADDYVVKPFSPRELVLRVNSVLRRSLPEFAREAPFALGPFRLDPSARLVSRDGIPLELSVREFDLFAFLLKHPQQTFDRPTLLRSVWGWEFGDLSTVTVTMRRLREKIEDDPGHPTVLVTVWGVGYRLELGDG
ncbi:response regulator transcription factor [Microbacterium hydrocarbonoxydans]|uniref:response regulator transcription factor n=1 Tax=Microbacterium hydrocarbonoxydans TaxID=273678 RepID=UPI0007BBD64D|nr:response regulator transcription factor [Microbacterium hydrocarbonoxydans]GAT71630.1 transcriptional regulatory protein YycF [Microbacterium sp. HM58-2]